MSELFFIASISIKHGALHPPPPCCPFDKVLFYLSNNRLRLRLQPFEFKHDTCSLTCLLFEVFFFPPGWWRGVRNQLPHTVLPPLLCWCKKFSVPAVSCLPAKGLLRQGAALGCKLLNTLFGAAHQDRYPHPLPLYVFRRNKKRIYTLGLEGCWRRFDRATDITCDTVKYQAGPLYRNIVFLISFCPLLAQVTYRGRPLSYYLLNVAAAGSAAQTRAEDAVPHAKTRCSPEKEVTGLWKFVLHSMSERLTYTQCWT